MHISHKEQASTMSFCPLNSSTRSLGVQGSPVLFRGHGAIAVTVWCCKIYIRILSSVLRLCRCRRLSRRDHQPRRQGASPYCHPCACFPRLSCFPFLNAGLRSFPRFAGPCPSFSRCSSIARSEIL